MNKKKFFYISSPIYYVNANPHLGHVYSTLYADFIARFQREQGKKVFFITGCDQHGNKIALAAEKKSQTPESFIQKNTEAFLDLWKKVDISYTHFVQTHDSKHQKFVIDTFNQFLLQKYVYLSNYQGYYCFGCEAFLNNDKIIEKEKLKICSTCQQSIQSIQEENFFLKVTSQEQQNLIQLITKWKKESISPAWFNQLNSFLSLPSLDFSISRPNLSWGIKLNDNQTAYVWFDALLSYWSVLDLESRSKIWQSEDSYIVHVLGKEITKFHLTYWPLFCQKKNYRLPNYFLIHGWILNQGQKMSKSIGNVIDPKWIIDKYGVVVLRLYLATLMNPKTDTKYSSEFLENFYRVDVVNNLSNYCYRLLSMVKKYQPNFQQISSLQLQFSTEKEKKEKDYQRFIQEYHDHFEQFAVGKAFKVIFALLDYGNQSIDQSKPWELIKDNKQYLTFLLYYWLLIIKIVASFLKPITPSLSQEMLQMINLSSSQSYDLKFDWDCPFVVDKVIKLFQ